MNIQTVPPPDMIDLMEASQRYYIHPRVLATHCALGNIAGVRVKVPAKGIYKWYVSPHDAKRVANGEFNIKRDRIRTLAETYKVNPPDKPPEQLAREAGLRTSSIIRALVIAGLTENPRGRFESRVNWLQVHPETFHLGPTRAREEYTRRTGDHPTKSGWGRVFKRVREILEFI